MNFFQKEPITSFSGKYRFLSNFYLCEVLFEGIKYPSSEHAYMASKTTDTQLKKLISTISKPSDAKKFGRKIALRKNWDSIKLDYMENILRVKFSVPILRENLNSTKNRVLIEGNNWGDTFWGESPLGNGENNLGKILMKIRDS